MPRTHAAARTDSVKTIVRGACPHDCPDTCAMLVTVVDGRALEVRGDPEHPFTRGALCVKVNDYVERVYSPERVLYPLRRVGPKGSGKFERIGWDAALDEIASRFKAIIAEHGPQAILPYSYLGTEGLLNGLNVGDAFFNRLGASISERTFCASGAITGYMMTVGPTPGTDPESLVHSRYIVIWACNVISTNLHLWPIIAEARRRGAKVVVIDPMRNRTAQEADWHIPIRPGTDGALALGMINVIINENLTDNDYIEKYTVGYPELKERAREYPPERVSGITGIPAADIVQLAREYARTQPAAIRFGVGIERQAGGGQCVRAISCLPALVGAWRKPGGGLVFMPNFAFPVKYEVLMRPDFIRPGTRHINQYHLGAALTGGTRSGAAYTGAVRLQLEPDGSGARSGSNRRRPLARGSVHGRERTVHHRHRRICRYRPARDDSTRAVRPDVLLGTSVSDAQHAGDLAARRGCPEYRDVPAAGGADGL